MIPWMGEYLDTNLALDSSNLEPCTPQSWPVCYLNGVRFRGVSDEAGSANQLTMLSAPHELGFGTP